MSEEKSDGEVKYIVADDELSYLIAMYRARDAAIKELEEHRAAIRKLIEKRIGDKEEVYFSDGTLQLTYKQNKPTLRFDSKWLKEKMPDVYEEFLVESPGARMFLLKKDE